MTEYDEAVERWMQSFPNRIWEPTDRGWSSRETTKEDLAQRRKFAREMVDARIERLRQ